MTIEQLEIQMEAATKSFCKTRRSSGDTGMFPAIIVYDHARTIQGFRHMIQCLAVFLLRNAFMYLLYTPRLV